MSKRVLAIVSFVLSVCMTIGIASADQRVTWYFGQVPTGQNLNQMERGLRLSMGTLRTTLFNGQSGYANLTVAPATGLYINVAPTNVSTFGALYQAGVADDASAWGGGPLYPGNALAADPTQITAQGLVSTTSPNIGPLAVPNTSGQSLIVLIECQVSPSDTTAQTSNFITSLGALSSNSVNRDRIDAVSCQSKTGSAAALPSAPTADSGWVGVAAVTIPYGTSTITTTMISQLPPIGFAPSQIYSTTYGGAKAGVCNLAANFGAYGDDVHDDSTAMASAMAAFSNGTCSEIVADAGKTFLINSAISPPTYIGTSASIAQRKLRITANSMNGSFYQNGASCNLDLRYNGSDGVNAAKIDSRGMGTLEIDHIEICDNAADHFPFIQTGYTTLNLHDVSIQGDPSQACVIPGSGTGCPTQDAIVLGSLGAQAASVSTTNGSTTLTIGGGDTPFTSSMVGWNIAYAASFSGTYYYSTIAAVVSSTQVTLANAATATISGGVSATQPTANYTINTKYEPFVGYNSTFNNVVFHHIRHIYTFGTYANGVDIEENTTDLTDGDSDANGSAYYWPLCFYYRTGSVIRGGSIEVLEYSYAAYLANEASSNTFDSIAMYDAGSFSLADYYLGSTTAEANTIIAGFSDPGSVPVVAGPGSSYGNILIGTKLTDFQVPLQVDQKTTLTGGSLTPALSISGYPGNGFNLSAQTIGASSDIGSNYAALAIGATSSSTVPAVVVSQGGTLQASISPVGAYTVGSSVFSKNNLTVAANAAGPDGIDIIAYPQNGYGYAGIKIGAPSDNNFSTLGLGAGIAFGLPSGSYNTFETFATAGVLTGYVDRLAGPHSIGPSCPGNTASIGTACYYSGSGAPTFSAPNGSQYLNYSGSTGSRVYYNTSGASTSGTTWTAVSGV